MNWNQKLQSVVLIQIHKSDNQCYNPKAPQPKNWHYHNCRCYISSVRSVKREVNGLQKGQKLPENESEEWKKLWDFHKPANIVKSLDPKQPAKGTCKCGILEGEKVKHYFALKQWLLLDPSRDSQAAHFDISIIYAAHLTLLECPNSELYFSKHYKEIVKCYVKKVLPTFELIN